MFGELTFEQPDQVTYVSHELAASEKTHRSYMGDHDYPQPDRWSSLLYAVQEFAEFIDAQYTRKMSGQKRNNDRQDNPALELGQCLSMLATALLSPDDEEDVTDAVLGERQLIADAAENIALALLSYGDGSIHRALTSVAALAPLVNVTPMEALHMSQEKTVRKWARMPILVAEEVEVQIANAG